MPAIRLKNGAGCHKWQEEKVAVRRLNYGNVLRLMRLIGDRFSHMIGYKKSILERQSLSEVKMARKKKKRCFYNNRGTVSE